MAAPISLNVNFECCLYDVYFSLLYDKEANIIAPRLLLPKRLWSSWTLDKYIYISSYCRAINDFGLSQACGLDLWDKSVILLHDMWPGYAKALGQIIIKAFHT